MIKFKYIIIAAIGLLLTVTACTDGTEIVRNMEVDATSMTLSKEVQTKIVKVTVDKEASFYVHWEGESWGSATANVTDGIVTVSVSEHTGLTPRKAWVTVSLGEGLRNKVIEITQNGSDPLLDVIPDEISFEFMGGEFIVEVESNAKWTVKNDVAWVEVESFTQSGEMIVKVLENKNIFNRTTTLLVSAGNSEKEVALIQESAPTMLLPYLEVANASVLLTTEFEQARHSLFIPGRATGEATTKSQLMPKISYTIASKRVSMVTCTINADKSSDFWPSEDNSGMFHDFLLDNNFEYLHKGKDLYPPYSDAEHYWLNMGEGAKFNYFVSVIPGASVVRYNATMYKPDHPSTPTFEALPYPTTLADTPWGSTDFEAIRTWETSNGGTISEEDAGGMIFTVSGGIYYKRAYFYTDGKLEEIQYMFHDYSKVTLLEFTGLHSTNPQFEQLLASEGFVATGAALLWSNASKNLLLHAGSAREDYVDPYYGVLTFSSVPVPAP